MKEKLTSKGISLLHPQAKTIEIYDTELVGMFLRVFPSGIKVFYVRYRLEDKTRHKYRIGRFGELTVQEAREKAKKILGEVVLGSNPKAVKHVASTATLRQFIEQEYRQWSETHHQWSKGHISRLYMFEELIDLPLTEITSQIVEKWRSKQLQNKKAPATLNRNTAILRSTLSKAVEWEIIATHPLSKLRQLKIDRSPNVRYLSEEEEIRLRNTLNARETKLRTERENANQ